MTTYFPLFWDMKDKKVQVFGGGNVAARRAGALLESGAIVRVTAPDIAKELQLMAKRQEGLWLERRTYCPGELKEEDFVLAATNDRRVNDAIYQECKEKHILVNVASDKEKCDFYFPGIVRQGDVVIGVTAGGKDHRRAAQVTEKIRKSL